MGVGMDVSAGGGLPVGRRERDDETVLAGQKKALELAVTGAPLPAVLDILARTVESQSANGVLASILLVDEAGKHLLHGAAPSLNAAYNEAIHGIAIGPAAGACGTAAHTGKTVVAQDIATDPLWVDFKDLALSHGLASCWSTPILSTTGVVLGTFALYHRVAATPTDRDRAVVELLAHTAALVIERDLHARKRAAAEVDLRAINDQQLARMDAMFEHAPAAIALLRGAEHKFEIANPAYRELLGGREVRGKSVRDVLPEVASQGYFDLLDGVRESGKPYVGRSQKVAFSRRPGAEPEEGFFDFVYQPVPGPDGGTESILVVAFEVTGLVKAKLEAEAARQRAEAGEHGLRSFIDNLPLLAWTATADGRVDYYNRRWYEYTGTTFEDMQGWGWEKVHDPDLLPKVVERWKHSLATGEPFEMEFTLRGADGIARWFLTRVSPLRDTNGNIVRWFGTNTNIDDIKAHMALTAAMADQSEETQRALLEMRAAKEHAEQQLATLQAEVKRNMST